MWGLVEGGGETAPALGSAGAQIRALQAFSSGLGKVSLFWPEASHSSLSLKGGGERGFLKTQREKGVAQASHRAAWLHSYCP